MPMASASMNTEADQHEGEHHGSVPYGMTREPQSSSGCLVSNGPSTFQCVYTVVPVGTQSAVSASRVT